MIRAAVRNWSDTVAYLLEAEVAQVVASDVIRHSYPVIFNRTMNFTLPRPRRALASKPRWTASPSSSRSAPTSTVLGGL